MFYLFQMFSTATNNVYMKKILYAHPSITNLEIEYVNDAVKNGWGENCFNYIKRLQESFKNYLGVKHAIATSSCTGALHLALASLNIGPGDEVIIPEITWIATASPVYYLGAKPVFVDILSDSWCIDPQKIEEAITCKTKAIIVVHLYGNLVEMDKILEIGKKHNISIIEDTAEALGSEYKGRKAGSLGDFGVFSFHGSKTMTTGEGGMLVSNREDLIEILHTLENHGRTYMCKKMFWPEIIGYKYKMSNIQAALGCAQLERIEELLNKKRQIFSWYKKALKKLSNISTNPEPMYTKNSFWMPTVVFNNSMKINRDKLLENLIERNIHARPFFYPLSSLPMFTKKAKNKISYSIYKRGLNLPSCFTLTENDATIVVKELINILNNLQKKS